MGTVHTALMNAQVMELQKQTRLAEDALAIQQGLDPEVVRAERKAAERARFAKTLAIVCWIFGFVCPPLWIYPIVRLIRRRNAA